METKRLLELEEAIKEWLAVEVKRDFVVGDDTARHMAIAAVAVLNAIDGAQRYALEEGYLEEPSETN
jgi:hypothetical protein